MLREETFWWISCGSVFVKGKCSSWDDFIPHFKQFTVFNFFSCQLSTCTCISWVLQTGETEVLVPLSDVSEGLPVPPFVAGSGLGTRGGTERVVGLGCGCQAASPVGSIPWRPVNSAGREGRSWGF